MVQQLLHKFVFLTLLLSATGALTSVAFAQGGIPHDQKAGSILFFNKYTSSSSNPNAQDTQINITNTSTDQAVDVHLYLVDGSTCGVADASISLTPNQTASFRTSDFDPGVQGYIVAVATAGGVPAQLNFLIGDAAIRESDGRQANLAAVAVAKIQPGLISTGETGDLVFDGKQYEQLPQVVAVSSFNSQNTDSTNLAIYSPANNFIIGGSGSLTVFALIYDDAEHAFSTSFSVPCYKQFPLASLRILTGFSSLVPAGRTGWIRMNASGNRPLLGAVLNKGPIFNSGHNLHTLSLLNTYTITIPVFG